MKEQVPKIFFNDCICKRKKNQGKKKYISNIFSSKEFFKSGEKEVKTWNTSET